MIIQVFAEPLTERQTAVSQTDIVGDVKRSLESSLADYGPLYIF